MEDNIKPYPKYKISEYDWLGNIPAHWEERSVRSLTKLSDERNGNRSDLELLSVYREYGVIRKASRDDNHNAESLNLSNYKYVGKNYLVMNKMKMWQGSLGVSRFEGIVSPAYLVCTFKEKHNYSYLQYLLRSATFKTQYNRISYGIRVGQWDMRYDDFKQIKLYLPPLPEQIQIANFLDYKVTLINKFIKNKKNEIMLLKEQKQAEINKAVTRGLNPNAKMKDSGITWIGEIPAHWEEFRLKTRLQLTNNKISAQNHKSYLGMENIESWSGKYIVTDLISEGQSNIFKTGNLLFGKLRPYLAKVYLAEFDGVCSTELLVYEVLKDNPKFMQYLLLSKGFIDTVNASTYGSKMPRANSNFIGNVRLPIPTIDEQQEIINYITTVEEQINTAVSAIENEITLIKDYKASLISDIVTGKIDVRNLEVEKIEDVPEEDLEEMEDTEEIENSEELNLITNYCDTVATIDLKISES